MRQFEDPFSRPPTRASLGARPSRCLFACTLLLGILAPRPAQAQEAQGGDLYVQSEPPGAAILLDGVETDQVTPVVLRELEPGAHAIRVERGCQVAEEEVLVRPRLVARSELALSLGVGSLRLGSIPVGATVTLDGAPRGSTPLSLEGVACGDHELALSLTGHAPVIQSLTLAVDFTPTGSMPAPALADLRLAVEGGVRLERIGITPDLLDAGKTLLRHPYTGKRYQLDRNGVHRFVLISSTGKRETKIPTGRWLLLRFAFDEPQAGSTAPAVFSLVQREDVFAPAAADLALQSEGYSGRVVVWREVAP